MVGDVEDKKGSGGNKYFPKFYCEGEREMSN